MAILLPQVAFSGLKLAQANRPDKQNFAVCAWARITATAGPVANLLSYWQDTPTFSWNGFTTANASNVLTWWSGGVNTSLATLVPNQWFWFAMKSDSTTTKVWYWAENTGLVTANRANTLSAGTVGYFDIGSHLYDEPWPGPIAGLKIFTSAISDDALLAEQWTLRPNNRAVLHSAYPMIDSIVANAIKDISGNGRDLTVLNTLTTADGPPVSWGAAVMGVNRNTLIARRATVLVNGVLQRLATGSLGTGAKPLVLNNGLWRQRSAAEGSPIILLNGNLKTLNSSTESLEI